MKDTLNLVVKNLIILGNLFGGLSFLIWFFLNLISKKKYEEANLTNPDLWINLIKCVFYGLGCIVSYSIYKNPKYINDVKDVISGVAYILCILEAVHNFLNSMCLPIISLINNIRTNEKKSFMQ